MGGEERGGGCAFTRGALLVVESRLGRSRPRLPLAWGWFLGGEACVAVLDEALLLREGLCRSLAGLVWYLLAGHPSARVLGSLST